MAQLAKRDVDQHNNFNEFDSLIESTEPQNNRKSIEWRSPRRLRRQQKYNDFDDDVNESSLGNALNNQNRLKRHAGGHSHDATNNLDSLVEVNKNTQFFIEKLFQQFGNGDKKTLNVNEFETMIQQLGLERLLENYHAKNTVKSNEHSDEDSNSTMSTPSVSDEPIFRFRF